MIRSNPSCREWKSACPHPRDPVMCPEQVTTVQWDKHHCSVLIIITMIRCRKNSIYPASINVDELAVVTKSTYNIQGRYL